MDEEDLREAEEARNLATADGFTGFGLTDQDSRRATGLMDILRPSGETNGSKLLKRMGWKEGQGIGPKVRRNANAGDGELESEESHLFAPNNSPMISFPRKTDHKGLGYEGEGHLGAIVSSNTATTKLASEDDEETQPAANLLTTKKATAESSHNRGFGIGVLNDTGSDDEDPYDVGPKISYNKVTGGDKRSKKRKGGVQTNANPLVQTRPVFLSKKLLSTKTGGFRRSRDGRLPLDGFVLADELDGFASVSIQEDNMKPPIVPAGWKSTKTPAVSAENLAYVSTADASRASALNAQGRAALLGEKPLPGKSVFDFLSPAARNKLASTSGRADLPQAGRQPPPPGYETSKEARQKYQQDLVPQLDSQVALQALSRGVGGWMPYSEDPSKRDRYRSFLEIRAGLLDQLPARAANATQEDWVNEMNEFARAAQVFKPVTGLMASRFTSSSAAPKTTPEESDNAAEETLLQKPIPKPEDPAVTAAKMGMFGPVTRTVLNFYPTRLVCKRFNVQPPENAIDPGNGTDIGSSRRSKPSQFDAYQYEVDPVGSVMLAINNTAHEEEASRVATPRQEEVVKVEPEKNEALEKARPGQDVFRAIFGSDDEDDD
jgi:G patch domain-containing protein 1